MRKLLVTALIVAFALSWTATGSVASKQVVVKQLESTDAIPIMVGPAGPAQACQVGNLNPPAVAIQGFILPPEEYKLTFDPRATCSVCPVGFDVHAVHIMLQTAGPCDIVMAVDVEEAAYPNSPTCPEPGALMCASGLFNVSLPAAGLYDISLPITCDCLTMDALYLLSFYVETVSCTPVPDLVTDAGPASLCTNWNNFGPGWYDLLAQYPTWPGDLIFFADADCCTPPVPVEESTWGAIKEKYND
jgi:hypothetical protein